MQLRICNRCRQELPIEQFAIDGHRKAKEGRARRCRACQKALSKAHYERNKPAYDEARRRFRLNRPELYRQYQLKCKRNRSPRFVPWADQEAINEIYRSCPAGFQVDHKFPMHGRGISGLHVHTNLQCLPATLNLKKGNRHPPTPLIGTDAEIDAQLARFFEEEINT